MTWRANALNLITVVCVRMCSGHKIATLKYVQRTALKYACTLQSHVIPKQMT